MLTDAFLRSPPLSGAMPENPSLNPVVHRVSDRRRTPFRRRGQTLHGLKVLSARLEDLLGRDTVHRQNVEHVRRRQRALRQQVSSVGWRAYLELEEAEFDRWAHALDRVAHWALAKGRRERGRR